MYSDKQRTNYLTLLNNIGEHWNDVFGGNRKYYSAAYFDLLTGLWKHGEVTKSEALRFIKAIHSSSSTRKCLDASIREKFVVERPNPYDSRSHLVTLSPDYRKNLDIFFDNVVDELKSTVDAISALDSKQSSAEAATQAR